MVHRGTTTLRISIAVYGLQTCHSRVYFCYRLAVPLVENDCPLSLLGAPDGACSETHVSEVGDASLTLARLTPQNEQRNLPSLVR